jgi:ribonuclease HI
MVIFEIYFDGACEPINPGGYMGYGFLVFKDGEFLKSGSYYEDKSPSNTNNVAEYNACLEALYFLEEYITLENINDYDINVFGDSMLVIKQMQGVWKINSGFYKIFAEKTKDKVGNFKNIKFQWIPREQNKDADEMSKRELKSRGIEETKWK